MLDRLRIHYKFKFLIKIKNLKTGLEISKIAPVFTQLGLEEGANLDDLLQEYFNIYCAPYFLTKEFDEFYIVLDLIIWRSTNMHNTIYIRPWTTGGLIFAYLNITKRISFFPFYLDPAEKILIIDKYWPIMQSKLYSFSLQFTTQLKWTPEWGYKWALKKFTSTVWTFRSTFFTYFKHFEMKGRKINFRRKVLKKKFEEYT